MTNETSPIISVVIPVYQAAACVPLLHKRLVAALQALGLSYEILYIDDGSTDGSWEALRDCANTEGSVKAVRLSRNFGQHAALTAGLQLARGQSIVTMDCDLQDAPEDIAKLYEKSRQGFEVVYATVDKHNVVLWRRWASWIYHRFVKALTGNENEMTMGGFSIISRKVVDALLQLHDVHRHYVVLLRYVGFPRAYVSVIRHARIAGRSSYTFGKLVRHGLDGIISQSDILLRWSIQLGLLSALMALLFMIHIVYLKLTRPGLPIGWSSLMAVMLLMGGLILIGIGILGIYIDKIFLQTKNRPLYFIDEKINV